MVLFIVEWFAIVADQAVHPHNATQLEAVPLGSPWGGSSASSGPQHTHGCDVPSSAAGRVADCLCVSSVIPHTDLNTAKLQQWQCGSSLAPLLVRHSRQS
jgi:hypothetical protein